MIEPIMFYQFEGVRFYFFPSGLGRCWSCSNRSFIEGWGRNYEAKVREALDNSTQNIAKTYKSGVCLNCRDPWYNENDFGPEENFIKALKIVLEQYPELALE